MNPEHLDSVSQTAATIPVLPELNRSLELIREYRDGDQDALNELFTRYQGRVRRIVGIRLGPTLRRFLEEDDIVQEVFLDAATHIADFEPRGHASILRWLSTITENRIRNKARYHQRAKRDAHRDVHLGRADSEAGGAPDPTAPGPTPSQHNMQLEIGQILDDAISALEPEQYRDIVLNRDFYGSSWDEVRDALDLVSVGAAQQMYRRAHEKLREGVLRRVGGPQEHRTRAR